MENTAEDIKRLQRCVNDLISVLALPALWGGSDSSQMVGTLLDVLLGMLRLDLAYARLSDSNDGPPIEVVRSAGRRHPPVQPQEVGQALQPWLTGDQAALRFVIPDPAGEGELSIASFRLGLQDEVGVLVAGSRRSDFPTDIERLLLRVAANQAGIGLQEARRSGQQKRVAQALEQRVAERTRQLTAINEELRRSEAYLAEAQRLGHTGSFGWRVSTGEILWSEETFRIFEYDGMTKPTVELILHRVHPEDAALVKQTLRHAAQDGEDFDHEYRLVMPDGSVKHVHVVAHAAGEEPGSIEFVGAVMDVTAAKQAEQRILKNQRDLRITIDALPAHVWSAQSDGAVDFMNQRALESTGLSLGDALGWGWGSAVHPDDLARFVDEWRAALAAGKPMEAEARVRRPDGGYCWWLIRNAPLRDELGNIVKWYGTGLEIEDRKRAEMLQAGEKRLLEMIARGDSRAVVLDALCRLVEELASGSLSSILLLDPKANRLRHGAAPSLPATYAKAINGMVIGPSGGSCGTAAYLAEPVIVSDIATDPLWADYRDLALVHGLRACWSTPILSSEGTVLGSFAVYYREPRSPTAQEHDVMEQMTHLASIALERAQAARALQQQANLLEQAHDAILVWEFPRTIVYWNRGAEQLYGYSREEAIGRPSRELLHTEHPMATRDFEAALERDGEWTGELVHTTRDGRKIVVESRHVLMRETDGRRLVLETNRDITERRLAEEALLRLGAIVACSDDAIISKTLEGVITSWNAGAQRIFGYAAAEAVGRPITILIPHDRQYEELKIIERVRRGESVRHFETIRIRKDGGQIHVSLAISPLKDANGRIIGVSKIARDITDRKRAEAELRESERRHRYIFQATGVSIWEQDFSNVKIAIDNLKAAGVRDFREYFAAHPEFVQQALMMVKIVDVNDVTVRLFAAETKDELLVSFHKVCVPETHEAFAGELIAMAEGRTSFEAETALQTLTGEKLTVLLTITFPPSPSGFDSVLVTVTDITESKLAEAERARLGQRLRQAEKMEAIGRLAGGIAHDFNNVLAGILAYGEMLFDEASAESPRKRYAQNVLTAATRGRALVEQILAYSRTQRGKREPADMCRTVAETLELVKGSLPANICVDASVPTLPLVVIADATQLHQVVMNLCSNAIQAMGAGGTLRVALETAELTAGRAASHGTLIPGRYVRLSVEDSGSGMDETTLSRIFEPFFTTKEIGRGTGLGLSLVDAIVTDLAGAIDVKSALTQGSTFAIYLPLAQVGLATTPQTEGSASPVDRERLFLVEDNSRIGEV
jgi:PAS domain S-box-containing protein